MKSAPRVLVTGASGMLGQELVSVLAHRFNVIGLSHQSALYERCDLASADEVRRLFNRHAFDSVIHTAAFSDVDGCEHDPKRAYEANAEAPKNLAEACAAKRIPWIHVSTDYVFDGKKRSPYVESDEVGPVNVYGFSKCAGEFFALGGEASCAVVRTSWVFGRGNPKNFVNAIMDRFKTVPVLSVLDDQIGAPTSARDLSIALMAIAERQLKERDVGPSNARKEIFHVCNTGGTTRLEMARWIGSVLGSAKTVSRTDPSQIQNRVAIRPEHSVLSNEKFQKEFGMTLRPWQDSVKEYVLTAVE